MQENDEQSQNVIENKWSINYKIQITRDVYENKQVIALYP